MKGAVSVYQCCLILPSLSPTRCHIGAASRSIVIRMCHLDGTSDSYFDLASGYVWESLPPPRRIVKGKAFQVSPDVTTSVKECQSQVVTHTSSLVVVGGTGTWSPRYLGHGGFPSPAWVSPLHPPPSDLSPCESRCVAFKKQCQVVFDTAGQFTKSPNKGFPVW